MWSHKKELKQTLIIYIRHNNLFIKRLKTLIFTIKVASLLYRNIFYSSLSHSLQHQFGGFAFPPTWRRQMPEKHMTSKFENLLR